MKLFLAILLLIPTLAYAEPVHIRVGVTVKTISTSVEPVYVDADGIGQY